MALLFPQTEIVVINGRILKPSTSGGVRRRSLTVGRIGAPLRTGDREARASETDSKEVYRYFSAPTPVRGDGSSIVPSLSASASASASSSSPPFLRQEKPSKKGGDDEDRRDYYVNTGYAIRTLREEYPAIFYREPTFDIYSGIAALAE
ncbi:hypothetical protein QJS04_geneDACA008109 [Acorus gramineus]|uniref:Uncharacterized protein n=1 Tax=Acorus gramineus TaxID=55184 RepID=A0AAV9AZB1_ACOGR|nr:hypothetical protein QJS04_geneDACA008109 [Acorus gramineus]